MTKSYHSNGHWAKQVTCDAMQLMAQAVGAQFPQPCRPNLPSQPLTPGDSFIHGGRRLQQASGAQIAPVPPVPQIGTSGGLARLSTGAVVIPHGQKQAGCKASGDLNLLKVAAASEAGVRSILLDIHADDRQDSVDNDSETLAEIGNFVNVSTQEYRIQSVVLGLSKDDVTMFTPGRPELDGVPSVASQSVMATLATAFKDNSNVALYLGGQPKNTNGSLNGEIDKIYTRITTDLRGCGFQHKVIVAAPQDYGRNLSFYADAGTSRNPVQSTDFEFMVTLEGNGTQEDTNSWITQGFELRKSFITGEQYSDTPGVLASESQAVRQLALIASQGDASFLSPFSGAESATETAQVPLLSGNLCIDSDAAVTLSPSGVALLHAQQNTVLG